MKNLIGLTILILALSGVFIAQTKTTTMKIGKNENQTLTAKEQNISKRALSGPDA